MNIWEHASTVPDLVACGRGRESDMFSQFFVLRILPIFHHVPSASFLVLLVQY
jgi:hypothetical protein